MKFYSAADIRAKDRRTARAKYPGYVVSTGYANKDDAKAHAKDIGEDRRRIQKIDGFWYVIAPTLANS